MGRNPGKRRSPAGQPSQAPFPAGTARRTVLAVPLLAALGAATSSAVAGSTAGQGGLPEAAPAGLPAPWGQAALAETLAEPLDPTKHPALGVLLAAYTRAPTEPVTVVALGSSSTAGADQVPANRWVNRLCAAMQSRYASGPGRDSATGNLSDPRNTLPGIHFHNGGLPGARSGTYLDAARLERVRTLAPGVLTHMVGSNDARDGTPAAVYRANMVRWLDALDAVLPQPHVHVLVHAHERSDSNLSALWNEYRAVLQGIARERQLTVVLVDLSRDFEAVGFPKGDPLNFLKDDRIHLTPAGHDFAARLLAQALMATARSTRTPLTDSFARTDGPLGTADSGQRWITTPGSAFSVSAHGVSVSAGGCAIAESSAAHVDAALRLTHTGAEDRAAGVVVRADPASGAGIGLYLNAGTGQRLSLHLLGAGPDLEIWGESRGIAPGEHEVRLVATGNTCIAFLDGSLVKAVSLPAEAAALAGNTGAGFGCVAATPAVSFRRVFVREA